MFHKTESIRRAVCFLTLIAVLLPFLSACNSKQTGASAPAPSKKTASSTSSPVAGKRLMDIKIQSEAVAKSKLGDSGSVGIHIYLPPDYYTDKDKRFPVVYFLHGCGDTFGELSVRGTDMDKAMKQPGTKQFIIVEPDGTNILGGSFFTNSPVIGNWEDYVTQDVVQYIDKNYRTIPKASARGISGFSMGGYSSLMIAMKHPDLFSCVLSLSPGLMRNQDLKGAVDEDWDDTFKEAYGAAFSPNLKLEKPYANIPQFDGSKSDNQVVQDWENGFGNIDVKIKNYLSLNKPLAGIKIVVGSNDSYEWIRNGCAEFAKQMKAKNHPIEMEITDGDHEIPYDYHGVKFASYFSKYLEDS